MILNQLIDLYSIILIVMVQNSLLTFSPWGGESQNLSQLPHCLKSSFLPHFKGQDLGSIHLPETSSRIRPSLQSHPASLELCLFLSLKTSFKWRSIFYLNWLLSTTKALIWPIAWVICNGFDRVWPRMTSNDLNDHFLTIFCNEITENKNCFWSSISQKTLY